MPGRGSEGGGGGECVPKYCVRVLCPSIVSGAHARVERGNFCGGEAHTHTNTNTNTHVLNSVDTHTHTHTYTYIQTHEQTGDRTTRSYEAQVIFNIFSCNGAYPGTTTVCVLTHKIKIKIK